MSTITKNTLEEVCVYIYIYIKAFVYFRDAFNMNIEYLFFFLLTLTVVYDMFKTRYKFRAWISVPKI